MRPVAPQKDGPQANEDILSAQVQLIDSDGSNRGELGTREAIAMAQEAGLDLVVISPNAVPPVAKILDLGKFKYSSQKKAAEARAKQKVIEVKEIRLRPNIDTHDYEVKMRAVEKFLAEGDKVKVTMRFRGREMAHQELGLDLLNKVRAQMESINIQRRARYTELASQRGATIEEVAAATACQIFSGRVGPGQYYRLPDGVWRRRNGSEPVPRPSHCG